MYSEEELKAIYEKLAAPFPEEAVERTRGVVTKKGYDTSGIKYQYVVNRLNEVLGVGGFRATREFSLRERESRSGMLMYEVTCDLVLQLGKWDDGQFVAFAEAAGTGGHTSTNEADAKKGSFTNGLKKAAAFFGVGRQAYEGTLDDDNVPPEDSPPAASSDAPTTERRQPPPRTNQQQQQRADGNDPGRVTSAQLAKLRGLITERGGDWERYRTYVRTKHSINIEYMSKKAASDLISGLLASATKGNGADERGQHEPGR